MKLVDFHMEHHLFPSVPSSHLRKVHFDVLGVLDEKTKEGNEVSCEYAKQCGISWSSLNCKK
jgi:fatty acid desaturase